MMLTTSLVALAAIAVTSTAAVLRTWVRERAYNERFSLMTKRVESEHRPLPSNDPEGPPGSDPHD